MFNLLVFVVGLYLLFRVFSDVARSIVGELDDPPASNESHNPPAHADAPGDAGEPALQAEHARPQKKRPGSRARTHEPKNRS